VPLSGLMRLDDGAVPPSALVVVTEVAGRSFGIVVDRVHDVEEIVVKPVAPLLRGLAIFAGATILGDGSVIMILDPAGIAAASALGAASVSAPATPPAAPVRDHRMSLLLFRAGAGLKAVPLGVVARLEELDLAAIESVGGRPAVQYRGRIMPLATVTPQDVLEGEGRRPVLVFAHGDAVMGLVVDAIEDIVDEGVAIERTAGAQPGLLGSAIVAGKATDIIDAGYYLKRARDDWFATAPQRRRVLLIENSVFARNLLTPLLTAAGYDVTTVESAEAALALSEAGTDFDAIVSDGALASTLRDGPWRDTPLVAPDAIQKLDRAALLDGLDRAFGQAAA
jgi:two-component system, chemotaxis family, sensor kinase CheA